MNGRTPTLTLILPIGKESDHADYRRLQKYFFYSELHD